MSKNAYASTSADNFSAVYNRDAPAYGLQPSAELHQYLQQCAPSGQALDLGAGAGRDSLALARHGLHVTCVDASASGLELLRQRATKAGIADRIKTVHADARTFDLSKQTFQAITATTVLDHIPADDASPLFAKLVAALDDHGILYVEVHTTDDPGCQQCTATGDAAPISETAQWVINYFPRGGLLQLASSQTRLRVLRYEERYEWDYTHGPEHKHAKAILLATTHAADPPWYGHPHAFPRKSANSTANP